MCLSACGQASVVVQVEDPTGAATFADHLSVSTSARTESEALVLNGQLFPVTFVVTGEDGQQGIVRVFAHSGEIRLAVGSTPISISSTGVGSAVIRLEPACASDEACNDDLFCTGEETCVEGLCQTGPPPCGAGLEGCAELVCVEAARACQVISPSGLDDNNSCTDDLCVAGQVQHRATREGLGCELAGMTGRCAQGRCEP